MADDTRLAEASLLLNYSSQSYREQLLLNERLIKKEPDDPNRTRDQLVEKNLSSKLITPPPEHEFASESHENMAFENKFTNLSENVPNQTVDYGSESSSKDDNEPNRIISYYNDYCDVNREPINNLLAAVNCALPSLKSRPNILQRSSMHTITSRSLTCPPSMPDHDYCQQDQRSLSIHSGGCLKMIEQDIAANEIPAQCIKSGIEKSDGLRIHSGSKRKQKHSNSLESFNISKKPLKLVAVHLGAGNSHNDTESLELAKAICEEVMLQISTPCLISSSKKKRKTSCYSSTQDNLNYQGECRDHHINEKEITAESAVVQLIKRMEDNQALNCGYGSNLNIRGQVECDASLMSDKTQMWAGVGAVSGCRNPIMLAKSLYDHSTIPRPLGLIQPNILVGSGAKQWMREHCPHLSIMDSKMITTRSFSTYQKLKSRYDAAIKSLNQDSTVFVQSKCDSSPPVSHKSELISDNISESTQLDSSIPTIIDSTSSTSTHYSPTTLDHGFYCITTSDNLKKVPSFARAIDRMRDYEERNCAESAFNSTNHNGNLYTNKEFCVNSLDNRLDTVGAIAVDSDNNFASAISSGGLLLKYKGRIGQAAIPGAGCWSEDSVAVTTTGVGEYLTLNMFARKFYDKMLTLRLLYDLGHVEKKSDLSSLISCGMDECFEDLLRSPALAHVPPHERLAGMLSVSTLNSKDSPKRVDDKDLYLSYAHNTNSMCIGYMSCKDIVGHSVMSRREGEKDGSRAVVRTMKFSLDPNKFVDSYFDNETNQL